MPRIEDIVHIWEPWSPIKADLEAQGYKKGAISRDQSITDQRTAIWTTCPECGRNCNCVSFNKDMKSYRSYIVCFSCNTATRLS